MPSPGADPVHEVGGTTHRPDQPQMPEGVVTLNADRCIECGDILSLEAPLYTCTDGDGDHGPTESVKLILVSDLPLILAAERERVIEAVYQELSAEHYLPDHFLIGHLDNARATLDTTKGDTDD